MGAYQTVLVGTDGSDSSYRAVDRAADRAHQFWMAMGFAEVGDDEAVFTDGDIEALRTWGALVASGTIAREDEVALARVMGQALSRLAEWQAREVMTRADLAALIEAFEEDTSAAVVSNRGQVVKMVGDEVLFVTAQPGDAAEIALRLTAPDRDRKDLPALRVGMAVGRVLTRFGDVYGPVVNLAARLTSLAKPGTALVDAELAAALRANGRYRLQHRRTTAVRGYHRLRSWALRPRGLRLKPSPGPCHGAVIGANSTALGGYVGSV